RSTIRSWNTTRSAKSSRPTSSPGCSTSRRRNCSSSTSPSRRKRRRSASRNVPRRACAMDFFAHQEAARKRTGLLLFYYGAAVAILIALTYFAALLALHWAHVTSIWKPRLFLWTSGLTLGVIALGSLWRILDLREGGLADAEMLG